MGDSSSSSDSDDMYRKQKHMMLSIVSYMREQCSTSRSVPRNPCRTCVLTGEMWVKDIVQGNPIRCFQTFRMPVHIFRTLCRVLRDDYGLRESPRISIPEMVGLFLHTAGHGCSNRDQQERFQHSGETISRMIHHVLRALLSLSTDIIKPRGNQLNETPRYIREHDKVAYRYIFRDCIGALDGTHIRAVIPNETRDKYIGRKGLPTQNVLALCDFDMLYTYVSAGWEGSAHDQRVLDHSIRTARLNFPHPPPGKYYLVDAGYANKDGYLAPYKGERYHIPAYRGGAPATGAREMFNKAHAKLRNVIERTFGVTKKKWKILDDMTSYFPKDQARLVIACMTLHNFIRIHAQHDRDFNAYESTSASGSNTEVLVELTDEAEADDTVVIEDTSMVAFRDHIAGQLYSASRR